MQELDDHALLGAYVKRGSDSAFAALVERHVNKVYSVALRHTGNPAHAEEITQAVFVLLAQKAGRVAETTVLAGWLYKTARLTAITFVRGEIRRARRQQEAIMESGSDDHDSEVWAQIAPLIDNALAGLNERDRLAVVLRFFYGKSIKEIGVALGASELSARVRLHRSLEKLRHFFLKRGIASTTDSIAGAMSAHSIHVLPISAAHAIAAVAAAKGAGASASTFALVQSASKLMVCAQAKPVVAAAGGILAIAMAAMVVFDGLHLGRSPGPDLTGAWEGLALLEYCGINSGDSASSSHVVLRFARTNGGYQAFSDWTELGLRDVPMGRVIYKYPSLQLRRTPREYWDLTVNANGTQMFWKRSRHFIQPSPVMFLRTTSPHATPDRLVPAEFAPRSGSDLQGYWTGTIEVKPIALPLNLKIAESWNGSFRGELESPLEGVSGVPLIVKYERPLLKMPDAVEHLLIQGAVSSNSTEIIGSVTSGGHSFPIHFKRGDYEVEHKRDSERSYLFSSWDEWQGHWSGSWVATIDKTKAEIRLVLDIAKFPDGSYLAELRKIDDLGEDAPIAADEFLFKAHEINLRWKWLKVGFDGRLERGKLVGHWLQGGGSFPLALERNK